MRPVIPQPYKYMYAYESMTNIQISKEVDHGNPAKDMHTNLEVVGLWH